MSGHCSSSFYEGHMERRTGKIRRAFSGMHRAFGRLDAGSRAGFTSSRPPPPSPSGQAALQTVVYLFYFCFQHRHIIAAPRTAASMPQMLIFDILMLRERTHTR